MKTAIILFVIALVIRIGAIFIWQFDGLYGQDAFAYFQQAIAITETLPRGQLPPPDFFWPSGYPALIAFFMLFFGKSALAGQLAALLSGAALAPLAYWLTKELEPASPLGDRGGLMAGLTIAVAGQPILSSIVVMADMPALFWATLSAGAVVKACQTRPTGQESRAGPSLWFLLAGAALALAITSRWIYVLITPALVAYTLFQVWRGQVSRWSPTWAAVSGLMLLAPQLWLNRQKSDTLLHSWLLGWRPINFVLRHFENIDGHFSYQLPVGVFYAQPAGHPAYIFPLLGLAAGWAVWILGRSKRWAALILLLGWAAPVYLFLGGIPYQNFRFGLTLYLPLVILTGLGLSDLLGRSISYQSDPSTISAFQKYWWLFSPTALKIIIGLSLLGMLTWAYPMLNSFLTSQNQSKVIVRQVEQQLPAGSTLVTFGLTLTFQHYTPLKTLELFYFDEASLTKFTKSQLPFYLLLDPANLETQWQGKAPAKNFQWLKEHLTLTQIDTFSPYILFKVEPLSSP